MTGHIFDEASMLLPRSDGSVAAQTHDGYWNMAGPFGGITSAILLRAVLEHPERIGEPVSVTVNFCGAIAKGEMAIRAVPVRTGKSTQHWTVTLSQAAGTMATASAVTALRRETWSKAIAQSPEVPPADTIAPFERPNASGWTTRYDMRFVEGAPAFGKPGPSRSVLWLSDKPDRRLDQLSLMAMSDAFIVRILHVRGDIPPVGTVSLTTQFHAHPDTLARQGTRPILGVADSRLLSRNFFDQTGELWSDDGELLATSSQMAWFRD